jgi:hypothetical protein
MVFGLASQLNRLFNFIPQWTQAEFDWPHKVFRVDTGQKFRIQRS